MYSYLIGLTLFTVGNVIALPVPSNPFKHDLGVKVVGADNKKSELTICCHGYGHSHQIVDVVNSRRIFDHQLVGFNFPDYGITDASDHNKVVYGTIDELLPLLYILKFYVCDQSIEKINLYGFSAGGGAIINALAILNNYSHPDQLRKINLRQDDAKKIIAALTKGIVILECPLKSMQELIDFRGATQNLMLITNNYNKNKLNPIDSVQHLSGLKLTIFLYFVNPDEIISNRDDALFIDRLKRSNKGMTYIVSGTKGGHTGPHPELWARTFCPN